MMSCCLRHIFPRHLSWACFDWLIISAEQVSVKHIHTNVAQVYVDGHQFFRCIEFNQMHFYEFISFKYRHHYPPYIPIHLLFFKPLCFAEVSWYTVCWLRFSSCSLYWCRRFRLLWSPPIVFFLASLKSR